MGFLDCQLIREAEHFIYIGTLLACYPSEVFLTFLLENQFLYDLFYLSRAKRVSLPPSISNTEKGGPVQNLIAGALVERILQAANAGEKFKVGLIRDGAPFLSYSPPI